MNFVSVTSRVVTGSTGGGQNLSHEECYSILLKTTNYSACHIFVCAFVTRKLGGGFQSVTINVCGVCFLLAL